MGAIILAAPDGSAVPPHLSMREGRHSLHRAWMWLGCEWGPSTQVRCIAGKKEIMLVARAKQRGTWRGSQRPSPLNSEQCNLLGRWFPLDSQETAGAPFPCVEGSRLPLYMWALGFALYCTAFYKNMSFSDGPKPQALSSWVCESPFGVCMHNWVFLP